MSGQDNNIKAFFELVKAGLWEKDAHLLQYGEIDYMEVFRLAEEQSVVGLIAAGLEHVQDVKVPQEELLQFVGRALQVEQQNKAMNEFIAKLIDELRKDDVYAILVKGQGIAQCYERPLWRTSGDVDLYLSESNYEKAKACLLPLAVFVDKEDMNRQHLAMTIDSWMVELHGTLHTGISRRMNVVSDEVHYDIFYNGNVRSWNNNGITVFLPNENNDIIIIFNHFINHFYGEGIGLRQICDWCRLLFTYKDSQDYDLLESRIRKMGLMLEWKVFGAFAVDYLGMQSDVMPFYDKRFKYSRKASLLSEMIIETGSFGANKDYSYRGQTSKWKEYFMTFFCRMGEFARVARLFPKNACVFFITYVLNRLIVIFE